MVSVNLVRSSRVKTSFDFFQHGLCPVELQVCVYKKLSFLTLFKVSL